jgi:glycosyltransferase involved in cell wall biosynthesis
MFGLGTQNLPISLDQNIHYNRGMISIGLAIITFNEERTIGRVLDSANFVDKVIIVDSFSTDATVEIAQNKGATVIQRKWSGYADQKQYCLEQLETDWVLVLDGDECLSDKLSSEIQELFKSTPKFNAYHLKRNLFFLNRELKHGRGTDLQLRLFKRGEGQYTKRNIHEEIIVTCETSTLKNQVIHYSSQSIQAELDKITRDTEMELVNYKNQRIGIKDIFIQPIQFFITMMVKGSWKDGIPGSIFLALTTFKYIILRAKLYELSILKDKK